MADCSEYALVAGEDMEVMILFRATGWEYEEAMIEFDMGHGWRFSSHPLRVGSFKGRPDAPPRYTQPEAEQKLVLEKLQLKLPPQPPPRIRSRIAAFPPAEKATGGSDLVVET